MECYSCGKEEDILYTCPDCKKDAGYCSDHRYEHNHIKPEPKPVEAPRQESTTKIPQGQTITNENVWKLVPNAWTSGSEWKDLIIGSFILTLIFGLNYAVNFPDVQMPDRFQLKIIVVIGILVSIAFIVHELSHKFTAIHYGHDARFILDVVRIGISLVFIIIDWSFIWIGAAVVFAKHGMGEEHGIIAGAGPFSNLVMGSIGIGLFYILDALGMGLTPIWDIPLFVWISIFVYLNGFIGLFNMIPFAFLDGAKIWAWNRNVWISLTFGLFIMWLMGIGLTPFNLT